MGDDLLGKKVQDLVSGFIGIAATRIEYLNGCIQYCLVPEVKENGKYEEGIYFDANQLKVLDHNHVLHGTTGQDDSASQYASGGPTTNAPKSYGG